MKKSNKKILLIAATHGDERIGLEVVKKLTELKMNSFFDFLIANPKACAKNTRFLDSDLNRSYPGNKKSSNYEERLAAKNIKIARKYKYTIDLHEAKFGTKNFIIIPRNNLDTNFPLNLIGLNTIILWPDPKGALGSCLKNTIELEFGMKGKKRRSVIKKAVQVIKDFIILSSSPNKTKAKKILNKSLFKVYGKFEVKEARKFHKKFKDFQKAKINGEEFYPLLVNQYRNLGIAFYKMKRIK